MTARTSSWLVPTLVHGHGSRMLVIDDGEAALVLTGPPYFPPEVETSLQGGARDLADVGRITDSINAYAWSHRPVLEECLRVLIPGGHLVMQTRDVRLRDRLVPVEAIHREMSEAVGFILFARHFWRPQHTTITRRRSLDALMRQCGPVPFDPEVFLVFSKPGPAHMGQPIQIDVDLLQRDYMRTSTGRIPRRHRFQSPVPVLEAFIRAYSMPGDLVVDPFAGGGTVLRAASALGRRAVGYDIDADAVALARSNLDVPANP